MKETLKIEDDYVYVTFNEIKRTKFYYIWLRDHCKCEQCYSEFYNQILHNIADIPLDIKPSSCKIFNGKLHIIWKDRHKTEYEMSWLENISFPNVSSPEIVLWDKEIITKELKKIPLEVYYKNLDGVKKLVHFITKYGFAIINGVENTLEATEKVVRHFSSVYKTHFGEMWRVYFDSTCNDTSSSNITLMPHNDNTYWKNAAGLVIVAISLIVFHLLHRNGEGGETILVDGFNVAETVRSKDPRAFDALCNLAIKTHFIDNSQRYSFTEPVIKLHSITKQLDQIRFNIYDRSLMTSLPEEEIPNFYKAYQFFAKEAFDSKNQFKIQLEPGDVCFIDNYRVLHGRNAFAGDRNLGGCYVSRDDYLSKVEMLNSNIH